MNSLRTGSFFAALAMSGLLTISTAFEAESAPEVRPPDSSLTDNGAYYRYKGRQVKLLEFNDRASVVYKSNLTAMSTAAGNSTRLRGLPLRHVRRGKHPVDILSFSQPLHNHMRQRGFGATLDSLRTIAETDRSVSFLAPVYYEPASGNEIVLTERICVKFTDSTDAALRIRVATLLDASIEERLIPSVYAFTCANLGAGSGVPERCRMLEGVAGIEWAEPEMMSKIERYYTPNDPFFGDEWHLNNTGLNGATAGADMKVTQAWDIRQMGDPAISIAILDDGVDAAHGDLHLSSNGYDFYNNDASPIPTDPDDNHGTACAGVAAAIGNNGIGVAGVSAGSEIMPIKISQGIDFTPYSNIGTAITWAYEHDADILSNSWGGTGVSNILDEAMINASTLGRDGKGCPVFAATGNSASTFTTAVINIHASTQYAIAFVYEKDGSDTAGDDRVAIDNIVLFDIDGSSVVMSETFSGGSIPTGWSTSGGSTSAPTTPVPGTPAWSATNTLYASGFGDNTSIVSGAIGHNQWTELRMPLRAYQSGQRLQFQASVSTEANADVLKIRYYSASGTFIEELVLASGVNETDPAIAFPASSDSVIAVGASNDHDFRSSYSQYDVSGTGKTVDFLAPSGGGWHGIYTTDRSGTPGYSTSDYTSTFSGTSSACPAAAGVAALILSRNPHLSRNKVLEVMRASCDQIGGVTYTNGRNNEYGYGRLNAFEALSNLPPAIIGQNFIGVLRNGSVAITAGNLNIVDPGTSPASFVLTLHSGSNYTLSGTTVTPAANYTGTLSVPITVSDGEFSSDLFTLAITVLASNTAPVITGQAAISLLEDGQRAITTADFTITDADNPAGPFTITIQPGANYTVTNATVIPTPDFYGTLTVPVTASDGYSQSNTFNTMVTVTPVNDAPGFTPGPNIAVNEDAGAYSAVWATAISRGPSNESGQSVGFNLSTTNGGLFLAAPSITPAGILAFTPAANAHGEATIRATLNDNGGTLNGGIDASAQVTFTVTVRSVNDPPVFTPGANLTVNEDAGAQTVTSWATGIGRGAPDESGQTVGFSTSNNNTALFSQQPQVALTGTLTYTPAANQYGSAEVRVRLGDNGGTENGGSDSGAAVTVTITIQPVNDAPSFVAGSNITCNEDAGLQSSPGWATSVSAGPNESAQRLAFGVTTSQTSLFSVQPAISATGTLSFTTAPNISGQATVGVRLRDSSGTSLGGIDSSALATFTITVTAVNDAPTLSPGSPVSVNEDAGPQTFPAWAAITAGAPDEQQTVAISLTVTNPDLFSTGPVLASNGQLTFTPVANRYGTAQVTAVLTDNGGTANGGVNTFTALPFPIVILPVNDAPTFTAGTDITVSEDSPPQVIPGWASSLFAGANETDQTLAFTVTASNSALFSLLPAIDASGTLSFSLAPDANGISPITIRLRDNGGTDRGGCDSSIAHYATITVTPVNDRPRMTITGNRDIVLGATETITINAADVDGTVPVIRAATLPSFAVFSTTSGSGTAAIACSPAADTGTYSFTVTADDGQLTVDSVITLRVRPIPSGTIEIIGAPADAAISLFATSGWTGTIKRTGPGPINGLVVGTYLLSVTRTGMRSEYYSFAIRPNSIDTIRVSLRPRVPVMFAAPVPAATSAGPLSAGTAVSAVMDDLDKDGRRDIAYIGADGVVRFARNNGAVFETPVSVLTLYSGRNTLRCLDWNGDNINDILSVNITGAVRISLGTGSLAFRRDSLLFNVTPGCTGVELVSDGSGGKRYYFSFSDGTVSCVSQTAGGTRTTLAVRLPDGTPVDVGDDADATALDVNGDGRNELLIGNAMGNVQAYTLTAPDSVRALGGIVAGGQSLAGTGGIFLSSTYGDTVGDLPKIFYADGNGAFYTSDGVIRGDINDDGAVDVLDLQQLGIHWGQRPTDSGWRGAANLQISTTAGTPQSINVLDLQVLGNNWGLRK